MLARRIVSRRFPSPRSVPWAEVDVARLPSCYGGSRVSDASDGLLRPALPQSAFERSKVSSNSQITLAVLEAYSRALMTHAAPPIALYAQIAASHVAAPSAAAPAPARLPLVDVSGGAAGPSFSGGGGGLSEQSSTRSGTLASPLAEDSRMSRGSVRDFTTSIGDYKWKVRQEDIDFHTRLGAGAYGEVWAGTWRRNEVAVKSLLHGTLSEAHTANFVREMELLSELRHANIVRFMGACLDEERMCILFELCPGSLYDLLHKSEDPLPDPPILVKLMREVALGTTTSTPSTLRCSTSTSSPPTCCSTRMAPPRCATSDCLM